MTVYHLIATHRHCDIQRTLSPLGCILEYDDMTTRAALPKMGKVVEVRNESQFHSLRLEPGDYVYFGGGRGTFYLSQSYVTPHYVKAILRKEKEEDLFVENTKYIVKVDRKTRRAILFTEESSDIIFEWEQVDPID